MTLFSVNQEKCNRDGICLDECPVGLIRFSADGEGFPEPIDEADELCINCGHCVSVCPTGALSLSTLTPEQCLPADKKRLPDKETTEHFLRYRRSIRTYKTDPVPQELISKLIHIARYAPSGHNRQPVKWLVVHNPQKVQTMAGMVADWMRYLLKEKPDFAMSMHMDRVVEAWENGQDRICRGAPHVIVTHTDKGDLSAPAACTIALTYLELATLPFGLGACWAGYFNAAASMWPPLQKALELPQDHGVFGSMMIGYPKYRYQRMPARNQPVINWLE